jgi:hypothetical protein
MRLSSSLARLIFGFAALLIFTSEPVSARSYSDDAPRGYYRSSDGSLVHDPTNGDHTEFGAVTADCRDGTESHSHHHRGTCSGHGGVSHWR